MPLTYYVEPGNRAHIMRNSYLTLCGRDISGHPQSFEADKTEVSLCKTCRRARESYLERNGFAEESGDKEPTHELVHVSDDNDIVLVQDPEGTVRRYVVAAQGARCDYMTMRGLGDPDLPMLTTHKADPDSDRSEVKDEDLDLLIAQLKHHRSDALLYRRLLELISTPEKSRTPKDRSWHRIDTEQE